MKQLFIFGLFVLLPFLIVAQQSKQQITLQPGWNSIYLELDPIPNKCTEFFKGIDIESVWALAKQFNTTSKTGLDWLIYHPKQTSLTELHQLQGGKSYLINLRGKESITLDLEGKPVLPSMTWQADTFSLAGFHIDADNAPTFTQYFAAVPELLNNEVLVMDTKGDWSPIKNLENTTIEKGVSYWVKCDKQSKFTAPISVQTEQEESLVFGTSITEQSLRIQNHADHDKQVLVQPISALATAKNLGSVDLTYWDTSTNKWTSLSAGLSVYVSAKSTTTMRIGIDRTTMPNRSNRQYESLLEVNDDEGTKLLLPVTANGLNERAGLWVGYATINAVSYVNSTDDTPQPTDSEFQLRLLVHVDDEGNANLLKQVTQMWKNGTTKSDPNNPNTEIIDEGGTYVLITEDALLDQYTGATVRDGQVVGRRLSTPFFAFDQPQLLSGMFEDNLRLDDLVLDYDDPLNPFKHQYHPDHNNLDERYENPLPEGRESYTVTRSLQLEFTEEDPEDLSLTGWGDNQVGGNYTEVIEGVHRQTLNVSGIFRLRRVSSINRLNEPPSISIPNIDISTRENEKKPDLPTASWELQAVPNPVLNEFTIKGLGIGTYEVTLRDVNAKLIRKFYMTEQESIQVSDLAAGAYFLEVSDGLKKKSVKFVKQSL